MRPRLSTLLGTSLLGSMALLLASASLLAAPDAALAKTVLTKAAGAKATPAKTSTAEKPGKPATTKPHTEVADTVEDDDDDGSPQREAFHVVKPGETLGGIANRAHVPRVLIIEANGLKAPFAVREGQRLRLPRTRHHTVAIGETGFDIAYHYGVPFSAIATANGLDPDAAVQPGQKLLIPTLTGAKAAEAKADSTKGDHLTKPPRADSASADADSKTDSTPGKATKVAASAHLVWPVAGKVVRKFIPRGSPDYHDGIDIVGKQGAAVRASGGGEVIFAGEEPQSFGRLVVIDHKNGWQTAYGFLGKITVTQGDHVRAGERIGLVGHSGKAKRDELHFEVRKANKPVDPLPELPDSPLAAR